MQFEADLDVVVDGSVAHVRGDGAALVIESADPRVLFNSMRRVAGTQPRRQLTLLAEGLAARGASIHVEGPQGRVVTVGADADSFALGLLAGTRRLAPRWRTLAVSSLADVVKSQRRRAVVGVVVAGVLATAVVAARAA